jgi:beta-galactosidase
MIRFGVDYHAAANHPAEWAQDAQLMLEAGVNTVRIASGEWGRLEPCPDQFEFGWLDGAANAFAPFGIQLLVSVPIATPPIWLATMYPEAGHVAGDGARRPGQLCQQQRGYRERAKTLLRAMARHFNSHPAVIGWVIESATDEVCSCPACLGNFHSWLREHYQSLQALNQAWGLLGECEPFTNW